MNDCLTQPLTTSQVLTTTMDTNLQTLQQTSQQQVVPPGDHNSINDSSANSAVNVSLNATIISANVSEPQNSIMTSVPNLTISSSTMPSATVCTQGSIQPISTQSQQQMVSSSQPQLIPTSQATHMTHNNALMAAQSLGATITSVSNQTVQIAGQQQQQHNQLQPLLQTSVQPATANQMSVAMSSLPQMQVIGQQIGGSPGTYQFQQVYSPQMVLPANMTFQNMPFGAPNQGLQLQIPFTGTHALNTATMPITSIAAKPPIMSKGLTISSLPQSHQMISQLKPNIGPHGQQILKQVLPAQQFIPHSTANQIVISQLLPQHNHHPIQQSILPATNKAILEAPKGKPFMLSHSGAIQPKSPILPATSMSSALMNSQFKTSFSGGPNTAQLIQTPQNLLTNQQILSAFQMPQGLTWTTSPQSTHLVAQNGSPIFIRGPTPGGEHMFISTSNMSNMSNPQIQTVSMAAPLNVHNTSASMAVNVTHNQSTPTQMTPTFQQMATTANVNTTTTTSMVTTSQPTAIAPAPTPPTLPKVRNIRHASSSVATQTITPAIAQKQHAESSTTPLKPIAPAKPKPSPQLLSQNTKPVNKDSNTTTMMRSTGVGSTQTISQPTLQSTKSDAGNQTTRVSVATETPKTNSQSQVSSSRHVNDHNKQLISKSNTSTNTGSESTQTKVHSVSEEVKTPTKRPIVEKRDASTGEDTDVMNNMYSQQNHKSLQNSVQLATNGSNGQQNSPQVLSDLNRQDISKQPPQKATIMVKPQVMTHVIDGYIIQESPLPFPVNGLSYSSEQKLVNNEHKNNTIIPMEINKTKNKNENSVNTSTSSTITPRNRSTSDRHCLNCGQKRKSNSKNRNFKKFCSQSCSEKYSANNDKNLTSSPRLSLYNSVTAQLDGSEPQKNHDLGVELSAIDTEKPTLDERKKRSLKRSQEVANDFNSHRNGDMNDSIDRNHRKSIPNTPIEIPSVNVIPTMSIVDEVAVGVSSATAGLYIPPGGRNPLQWSVNDVYEFVRNLQGCTEYADEFRSQEIDGQALMLIKEDHLMNTMSMKLGPALKICSKINALREDVQKQS
ncbi:unnamed protein product [Medioppia subpectinata]|uniref:SAM domain-containing protein n=1 Tax=Medioppia subpectinata TaxID=1979941 RepID=A0A7R9KK58_9ACAR|nr:unnamed protein product [Medioppia subpectinata]CAG2105201.1 unnamed protein product [Medioppia subpectinata]